jgi:prepilin-type N-terminal cleavage/methylation domain-containing protein
MLQQKNGFTLIELLVVIAIIATLMAILMPVLSRVRKQAKSVMCQSTLKQWNLIFSMYTNDNETRLPSWLQSAEPWPYMLKALWPQHQDTNDLFLCPMAKKPQSLVSSNQQMGSTFSAWSLRSVSSQIRIDCSYGVNIWAQHVPDGTSEYWQTIPSKHANNIPLLTDSALWWACGSDVGNPPEYEDVWDSSSLPSCMNRHNGFINSVFMDWSVRKVGVKQLWTLKWHRKFNIQGSWTEAGNVQPADWPEWMRGFRDY